MTWWTVVTVVRRRATGVIEVVDPPLEVVDPSGDGAHGPGRGDPELAHLPGEVTDVPTREALDRDLHAATRRPRRGGGRVDVDVGGGVEGPQVAGEVGGDAALGPAAQRRVDLIELDRRVRCEHGRRRAVRPRRHERRGDPPSCEPARSRLATLAARLRAPGRCTGASVGSRPVTDPDLPRLQEQVRELATQIADQLAPEPLSQITAHLARLAAPRRTRRAARRRAGPRGAPAGAGRSRRRPSGRRRGDVAAALQQLSDEVAAHRDRARRRAGRPGRLAPRRHAPPPRDRWRARRPPRPLRPRRAAAAPGPPPTSRWPAASRPSSRRSATPSSAPGTAASGSTRPSGGARGHRRPLRGPRRSHRRDGWPGARPRVRGRRPPPPAGGPRRGGQRRGQRPRVRHAGPLAGPHGRPGRRHRGAHLARRGLARRRSCSCRSPST